MGKLSCFKSYDVRGRLGDNLDEDIAQRIGRAFAEALNPGSVVVGRDGRESSPVLQQALMLGLRNGGVDVLDIGLCGTEEVYFATDHFNAGGGIMVTASHNPIDYNGFKLVREGARPLSLENGLGQIHDLALMDNLPVLEKAGSYTRTSCLKEYCERVLSFVKPAKIGPLKIVVNAGNGVAGPTFDALAVALELRGARANFVKVHHNPDSTFPNGIPNPLLPENRASTSEAVLAQSADFGLAWDGDFDRCFFFDEAGDFVDGEYVVGLLAATFLEKSKGANIVHDTRVMWNTVDVVQRAGGHAIPSRTGHPLMKQKMRDVDAVYGGEMSAHHYFRDFMYCDSGMIPWLLVAEYLSISGMKLSQLIGGMKENFPSSGEINFQLEDPKAAIAAFEEVYLEDALSVDRLDGVSVVYPDWRANLRVSNTEPLLRLNVETRADGDLLRTQIRHISDIFTFR